MEAIDKGSSTTPLAAQSELARSDALRVEGNAAFKAGDLRRAKKSYTAALSLMEGVPDERVAKLEPTRRAQLLANRCQVHLALGQEAEAEADARAACTSASGWPKAHYRLGTVLLHRKEYLKAYGAFKQGWHLDPKNPELTKACQDAHEALAAHDRDKRSQARAPPPAAAAAGADLHTAAAAQTLKAARAAEASCAGAQAPADASAAAPPAAPPAAKVAEPSSAEERAPQHSFGDTEGGGLLLRVELPGVTGMGGVEVDVSHEAFALHVPKLYRLRLPWPRPVDADTAKAKFLKKSGVLQVTLQSPSS